MEIYIYGLLAGDPTEEFTVAWIDNRTGADGSSQLFEYGVSSLTESINVTGTPIPHSDAYIYFAELTNLSEDTQYIGRIDEALDAPPFKTLSGTFSPPFRMCFLSDVHSDANASSRIPLFETIRDEDPDIMLMAGDHVSQGFDMNAERSGQYLDMFSELFTVMNSNRLLPILNSPGNHDVSDFGQPEDGYYKLFFPTAYGLAPVDSNSCSIKLGEYLQLITMASFPAVSESKEIIPTGNWLENVVDDNVTLCLPFTHSPIFGTSNRSGDGPGDGSEFDYNLQTALQTYWWEHIGGRKNVQFIVNGHMHDRAKTVPLSLYSPNIDSLDAGNDDKALPYFEMPPVIQFGGGYITGRPALSPKWWVDFHHISGAQYHLITMLNDKVRFENKDVSGDTYPGESWEFSYERRLPSPADTKIRRKFIPL